MTRRRLGEISDREWLAIERAEFNRDEDRDQSRRERAEAAEYREDDPLVLCNEDPWGDA